MQKEVRFATANALTQRAQAGETVVLWETVSEPQPLRVPRPCKPRRSSLLSAGAPGRLRAAEETSRGEEEPTVKL